jgi:hypothetical protein
MLSLSHHFYLLKEIRTDFLFAQLTFETILLQNSEAALSKAQAAYPASTSYASMKCCSHFIRSAHAIRNDLIIPSSAVLDTGLNRLAIISALGDWVRPEAP